MRTIDELLKIMIDNIDMLDSGLCLLIWELHMDKLMTDKEYRFLMSYIFEHSPNNINCGYWWPVSQIMPRLNFLNKLYRRERRLNWFKNLFK